MSNAAPIRQKLTTQMEQAVEHLKRDLAGLRTGRASVALLDGVRVDYYGTMTPLKQIANISIPEARLITIQPWEPQKNQRNREGSGQFRFGCDTVERRKNYPRSPPAAHRRAPQRIDKTLQKAR